jgi:hypothetical protein
MTAIAHTPAAFELRAPGGSRAVPRSRRTFSLRATGDGWVLLGAEGEVVFHGLGVGGRRQCLEFARELGVLAVMA